MKFVRKPDPFTDLPTKHHYYIFEKGKPVGVIEYKPYRKKYILVSFLEIYPEYRNQHLGYSAVELLMKKHPTKSLVGETLESSRGFWGKCISKYNGTRKNMAICTNCTSSFIIPKREISGQELWDCLMVGYELD